MKSLLNFLVIVGMLLSLLGAEAVSADDFSCSSVTDVPVVECEALVALYNSTNGAGWTNRNNWLETVTVGNWYGITVESGHVVVLVLPDNNLEGSLPSQIGHLTELWGLDLSYNKLFNYIPPEIGNFRIIKEISLSNNNLSGPIPTEIGELKTLQVLKLQHNHLEGIIPSSIGELSELTALDLSYNNLQGAIPREIGQLSNLMVLVLNFDNLEGNIPAEIGNLTKLRIFEAISNRLDGNIPSEIGNITDLFHLFLAENNLSGNIPPALGNLQNLEVLYLSFNHLSGEIPVELSNASSLRTLYLRGNHLTGFIPEELGNLTNLRDLDLAANQLSGNIPASLGNLLNLESLELCDNHLSGTIPNELGNLVKLWNLRLCNNELSGSIPSWLGNLQNLQYLILSGNNFDGDIPPEIQNLMNLRPLVVNSLLDVQVGLINLSNHLHIEKTLDLAYNFLKVPDGYPESGNAFHQFLYQRDPDWHLRQAVSQQIAPDSGGTITSRDGAVQVQVPKDALDDTVTFTFIPQAQPSQSSGELAFANQSFQLIAENSSGSRVRVFDQPLTVTISYNEADLGGASEDDLRLFYWDEESSAWKDAATTCTPPSIYRRNLEENRFSVDICHLTEFGVFVSPQVKVYLPLVRR